MNKQCSKCKKVFPNTAEYFHRNRVNKDGLNVICKECIKEYQNKYYNEPLPEREEKPVEVYMTAKEIREKILNKYAIGQEVNIRLRDAKGKIAARKKARILKYYPHMIMCEVDNYRESFTYGDFNGLITYGKGMRG